jgi:hypothetical protein
MPTEYLPPSTPQDQTGAGNEPRPQAPSGEGTEGPEQGGQSSIQKLKSKLRSALEAQEYWKHQYEGVQGEITTLRDDVSELKKMRDPKGPEDYSEADLLNVALDAESDQGQAMKAFMHFMNKRLNTLEENMTGRVDAKVTDHFKNRDRDLSYTAELEQLKTRFGRDSLQPGSELHDRASQYYLALKERVAEPDGSINRGVKRLIEIQAVERAARDLGLDKRQTTQPPEGATPSTDDRLESGSDGVAERRAKADELLKRGDWKGAISERVRAEFGVS